MKKNENRVLLIVRHHLLL